MASTSSGRTPASARARCTVGTIASRCAREAISGTTPPKRSCSPTDVASASASSVCPRTSPTPVSSHEVSNPSTRGSSTTEPLPLHHHGVGAARLVVAAPPADLGEPAPPVQALRELVVRAHLEQDDGDTAPVGLGQQRVEQPRAEAGALPRRGHPERRDVRLVRVGDQAAVADQLVAVLGHQVPAGVGVRELVAVHRRRPGVRREELLLEPQDGGQVGRPHRPKAHRHGCETVLIDDGGVASGRRRYSGTSGPADDGSASWGAAARSSPAVVTSAGGTEAPSRSANVASPTNGPSATRSSGRSTPGPSTRVPVAS